MRYTLSEGYDRQLKQRIEKAALYATPLAILLIVGVASLTNNTTSGPGTGSRGTSSGQVESASTGQQDFQNAADNDTGQSTTNGSQAQGSTQATSSNTGSGASGSTASASSVKSTGSSGGSVASTSSSAVQGGRGSGESTTGTVQHSIPTVTTAPSTPTVPPTPSGGSGSGGGGGSCLCGTITPVTQTVTQPVNGVVEQATGTLGL